ncbi:MAG: serine hydrolase, partial [Lachnospiraceae bacterium]|nr:serine hydrolase [Lachnospiraceae bacterium]
KTPLDYEPGTKTVYSDLDYMILGLVAEKVTGKDLNTWLKETFWDPMGLTRITYNPLKNGFEPNDCAATELNGNTRDGLLDYEGYRTYTLQGEAHDEKAYYSMQGISGHAGLFASATDLAKLASVMLTGGYGEHRYFSQNVIDLFTAPKYEDAANWGLGWWRQGDGQRIWYFGTQAQSDVIGHTGWTGTFFMIDPDRDLIIVYLTNKINSRVTDASKSADKFDGNWYTAATIGFVPQILSIGMDTDCDISGQLLDLAADMVVESKKIIAEGATEDHPSMRNVKSKRELFEKMAAKCMGDEAHVEMLRKWIEGE